MKDAEFGRAVFLARCGIPFSVQETLPEAALIAASNINLMWQMPGLASWNPHTGKMDFTSVRQNG